MPPVGVILVTDGDEQACLAVETAARQLGLRCISASAGTPTRLSGQELVALIREADHEPVLVMVDDGGKAGTGPGEAALWTLAHHPEIRLLGAIAVAANTTESGVRVDCSVDRSGRVIPGPVNKNGEPAPGRLLHGDTASILRWLPVQVVVGVGDVGKMKGADRADHGAQLTTRAILEVLSRNGIPARR